jgi:WD40 repeat protein
MSNVPTSTSRCPACNALLVGPGPCLRCLAKVSLESEEAEERDRAEGFQVLELIGRGGAGKVYRAIQRGTNRTVALKVLGEGILASEESRHRFQQESGVALRLDHPNIVKILAVSPADEPEPWLALEYVEGRSLSDVLRRGLPAPRVVAEWLRQIAEAVEHAHEHGVLHRDLKPSNVLIDSEGNARLTDFGVARLIETSQAEMTRTGQILGTPAYMAPEQAAGKRAEVGPTADVYGLGAVLYHGLTGRAPFVADSVAAILHQVVNVDPVPLRRLNASLPRDLETVCLRCLEKESARRPQSAEAVAAELRRFLSSLPVLSQPPTPAEKMGRWARRHVRESALIAALAFSLVAGAVAIVCQWRATVAARKSAEVQAVRAERNNYATSMREAAAAVHEGRLAQADELLDEWLPQKTGYDYRGMEWFFLHQAATTQALATFSPRHEAGITGIVFLADGDRFVTICQGGKPRLWSLPERKLLGELQGVGVGHEDIALTPDGRWLLLADPSRGKVLRLDAGTFKPMGEYPGRDLTLSPDGKVLVTTLADPWTIQFGGRVEVFDTASGASLGVLSGNARRSIFKPDGSLLAVAKGDKGVALFDTRTWQHAGPDLETTRHVHDVTFTPDGKELIGCDWSGTVWSWEMPSGQRHLLQARTFRTSMTLLPPNGKRVFLASTDRLIHVLDPVSGQETGRLGGHADEVWSLAFTPDGRQLLSGGKDGRLMLWNATDPVENLASVATSRNSAPPLYFPDSREVLLRPYDRDPEALDPLTMRRRPLGGVGYVAAISQVGDLVAVHANTTSLAWFSGGDGTLLREVDLRGELKGGILDYQVSANGRWMALMEKRAQGCGVITVDLRDGRVVDHAQMETYSEQPQALSNDGRWLASGVGATLVLQDLAHPEVPAVTFRNPFYEFAGLAFSPDGKWLAAGNHDATVRVFRVPSLALEHELRGHYFDTPAVAFSPDGGTVISLGSREGLRFWRMDCGREAGFLADPESQHYMVLAPDGSSALVEKPDGFDVVRTRR